MDGNPMCEAWIGFAGSLVGALLAGLIAIIVMCRTNKQNKSIADKNIKIEFTNKLTDITSEFCSLLEQVNDLSRHKRMVEADRDMNLTKFGQYEVQINNLQSEISSICNQMNILVFKTKIMFSSHNNFHDESTYFAEMQNDALSNIPKNMFQDHLNKFEAKIADDIKQYIE